MLIVCVGVGHERTCLGVTTLIASSNYIHPSFRVHLRDDGPGCSSSSFFKICKTGVDLDT